MPAESESHSGRRTAIAVPDYFEAASVLDAERRVVWASPEFERRYARGRGTVGRTCFELVHHRTSPCTVAGEECPLEICRQRMAPVSVRHPHHGSCEPMRVECYPILDHHQARVERVLHIVRVPRDPAESILRSGWEPATRDLLETVARASACAASVLIEGETGTGKELLARVIHDLGPRSAGPFVPVDCSSFRDGVLDSELFGHERGAFTGADVARVGLVEACDGGTLFLDEIDDMPAAVQTKLLRLLESRTFRRLGSAVERSSDFRLICAGHPELDASVAAGRIRPDFFYRIDTVRIRLPALREQIERLPILVEHLKVRLGCGPACQLSEDAMGVLQHHSFPGNVRELLHVLERACLMAGGRTIERRHVAQIRQDLPARNGFAVPCDVVMSLEELQRAYLGWIAGRFEGDRRDLARRLGISERTLYRRLQCRGEAEGEDAR
jgi:DNA-binding NtrC family response regulator